MLHATKRAFLFLQGVLLLLACTATTTVNATNGYFLIGYGAKARSMGGAGIAFPQDAMAAGANPAGMSAVPSGLVVGGEFFNPPRKVAAENGRFGFQTPMANSATIYEAESGSNIFLIPSMGGVYQFNRKVSVGMTVLGNGANTRYSSDANFFTLTGLQPGQTSYGTLGVQLLQAQMLPTITYKATKNQAFGASLAFAVQQFRAYGLENFTKPEFQFSSDNNHLTNNGNDYSYGAGVRLGWLGDFADNKLSLGAYYASRTFMTKFDKYSGLFAEGGDFDIPEHYGIGLAVHPTDKLTFAADIQQILYSDVASVGNRHPTTSINDPCTRPITPCMNIPPGVTPQPTSQALGGVDGWGFGWRDATVYKLGVAYDLNDKWTLRAGYNYGKSVIPDNQLLFSMLAPAVIEQHYTAGFSYNLSKASAVDVSYVYGAENSQTCQVNSGCLTMLTQDPGAYVGAKMKIYALGASYSYKF